MTADDFSFSYLASGVLLNRFVSSQNRIVYRLTGIEPQLFSRWVGKKNYELSDHLGNVTVVVEDLLESDAGNSYANKAHVVMHNNYYAFGMAMPGRSVYTDRYRYGFNGKEKDDEIKGRGNSYDFGARIYDPRLGRWLACDPHSGKYPYLSSYNFVANQPIRAIDPDGRDIIILCDRDGAHGTGHQAILIGNDDEGWTYISKDSYEGPTGLEPSASKYTVKHFDKIEEFKNSPHNFVLKTGVHGTVKGEEAKTFDFKLDENGKKIQRYDDAYYIPTSQQNGKSTDEASRKAAEAVASGQYCLRDSDCSDVVSAALSVGQDNDGNDLKNGEASNFKKAILNIIYGAPFGEWIPEAPNLKQDYIEDNNKGVDYHDAIKATDYYIKPKK